MLRRLMLVVIVATLTLVSLTPDALAGAPSPPHSSASAASAVQRPA